MARITVEDCLKVIPNRFSLCHVAANRAKLFKKGASSLIETKNREVVTALREIAKGVIRLKE